MVVVDVGRLQIRMPRLKKKTAVLTLTIAMTLYFFVTYSLSGRQDTSTLSNIDIVFVTTLSSRDILSVNGYGCGANLSGVSCQDPVSARNTLNIDWSFQQTVVCPKDFFLLNHFPLKNEVVSLKCDNKTARIVLRRARTSGYIFSVPFGDKCLLHFIENSCLEGRTVPNVVHYVWYNDHRMDFFNLLSFISVVRFVKPCLILVHGPKLPHGIYWDYFIRVFPYIIHVKRDHVTSVGANKLAFAEHGSDVMRIQALRLYGGIYLDWDEVVLRPVDKFRDYPMTMGIEKPYFMGSQFIAARRGAEFLYLWLRSYHENYIDEWTYNALQVPFTIAKQNPDLIHVEGNRFTRPNYHGLHLIFNDTYDWSDNYAMHLFSRWYKEDFDESTIGMLNTTLGSVSRHVFYGNKELCKRRD